MNEIIFAISIVIELCFVFICFRLGREWLFGSILINLILVTTFGAKLVPFFGFVVNFGNVFYASVFVATYFLIEHHGSKNGLRSVWLGASAVTFFVLCSQFAISLQGIEQSEVISKTMSTLFHLAPRIFIASILAYILAQYLNVWLYSNLMDRDGSKKLWFRITVAAFFAQILDSIVFFLVAFFAVLPTHILLQTIGISAILKIGIGLLGIPLLYISRRFPSNQNK